MNEELVTVATAYDIVEAEFLRNQLESEGFAVFLADANLVGAYNLLAGAVGGVKVKVSANDADGARKMVAYLRNSGIEYSAENSSVENPAEDDDFDTGWGECQMCLSRDLTPRREFVGWKWILVFFWIPAVRAMRKLVCNNCGFEWLEKRRSR